MFTIREVYCAKCKKVFVPAALHRYVVRDKLYCSWHCYNHRDDNANNGMKRVAMYSPNGGTPLKCFKSASMAAIFMDAMPRRIQQACRDHKEYKGFIFKYIDEEKAVECDDSI